MSSNRVFGQQIQLFVVVDGSDNYLANIDSFNWKFDDIVKVNAALGQAGKGTIDKIDDGISGGFDSKMSDAILQTFMINMSKQARATAGYSAPNTGKRGRSPLFTLSCKYEFVDGTTLELAMRNCVLHNGEFGVTGNKEEFTEKWSFTGDYVDIIDITGTGDATGEQGELIAAALASINQSFGSTPKDYGSEAQAYK